ncbi:MAG TPA: hypothetical protein VFM96_03860 [Gaiellaceae bacterium]|nr:hypothetical protein [Gaiellaceae bacterium]
MKALLVVMLVALAAPAVASAHGRSEPVATNFEARITAYDGITAKIVDGDQRLWVRAHPAETILVPTFPVSHIVSGGHSYLWHEHRLHALEPVTRARATPWTVPLVVDGKPRTLVGVLDYHPPGRTWLWLSLASLLALTGATVALRNGRSAIRLALLATPVICAVRIARELYGRPNVGVTGYLEVVATSAVGAWVLYGLVNRNPDVRVFTAVVAGLAGLYQGLTMVPVLTHAIALTLLPTTAAKILVAGSLGLGAAALTGGVREQLR